MGGWGKGEKTGDMERIRKRIIISSLLGSEAYMGDAIYIHFSSQVEAGGAVATCK